MHTQRTPEQIAEDAADIVLRVNNYCGGKGAEILATNVETLGWALGEHITYETGLPQLVKAAIATDQAQRDIYELIAETLDERADMSDEGDDRARNAAAAVRGEGGYRDPIWDTFIGPMLDGLERVYGE